jgi:hypothetical protein
LGDCCLFRPGQALPMEEHRFGVVPGPVRTQRQHKIKTQRSEIKISVLCSSSSENMKLCVSVRSGNSVRLQEYSYTYSN